MHIRLTINCDNDAFTDEDGYCYPNQELARIFSKLSNQIKFGIIGDIPETLKDINGNNVGRIEITE